MNLWQRRPLTIRGQEPGYFGVLYHIHETSTDVSLPMKLESCHDASLSPALSV